MGDFSHLSSTGEAAMVRLGTKPATDRTATVSGAVLVSKICAEKLGPEAAREIIRTARLAGIQGAKQTANLVPLCHPIPLTAVDIDIAFEPSTPSFQIKTTTATQASTGVEMEAMAAAMVAGLTIYDMIKAVDPAATIGDFKLLEKHGGKNGAWHR